MLIIITKVCIKEKQKNLKYIFSYGRILHKNSFKSLICPNKRWNLEYLEFKKKKFSKDAIALPWHRQNETFKAFLIWFLPFAIFGLMRFTKVLSC